MCKCILIIPFPDSPLHEISRNTCCCFSFIFLITYILQSVIPAEATRGHTSGVCLLLPYQPSVVNSFSPRWGFHNPSLIIDRISDWNDSVPSYEGNQDCC